MSPIILRTGDGVQLTERAWAPRAADKKPIINFRSEKRHFGTQDSTDAAGSIQPWGLARLVISDHPLLVPLAAPYSPAGFPWGIVWLPAPR